MLDNLQNPPSILNLEAEITKLRSELLQCDIKEMSESPLTDEKLAFWRQRGALAEKYCQLGVALEREESYEDAARAYWDSFQINQNESAQKKLGLLKPQANHAGAPLVINSDLPIEAESCFYLGLRYLGDLGHSQNDTQAAACFSFYLG